MQEYLNPEFILLQLSLLLEKSSQTLLQINTIIECAVIVLSLAVGYLVSRPLTAKFVSLGERNKKKNQMQERFLMVFPPLIKFIFAVFFILICSEILAQQKIETLIIDICGRLLTAWTLIRFVTGMLQHHTWARIISLIIWAITALHILGLLPSIIKILDKLSLNIGETHISILLACKAIILFAVLLKAAGFISIFMEKRVVALPYLSPSVQVLLNKVVRIVLLVLAVISTMGVLGIDLSAFAFIGGAIGVGLGFGLQKVVSNLVSGIILLLDRSIKPGDVIEVGSTYGKIQSLGARYVSVATRDNTEYLIPNEDLITHQVVNWSFSNALIRLKIIFPVAYDSDIHQVMDIIVTSAGRVPRVLRTPKPVCQLNAFGDSSLDIELRFWICDPENGVSNVKSAVRISVWDVFRDKGIEIPFPQRDIHIKSSDNQEIFEPKYPQSET